MSWNLIWELPLGTFALWVILRFASWGLLDPIVDQLKELTQALAAQATATVAEVEQRKKFSETLAEALGLMADVEAEKSFDTGEVNALLHTALQLAVGDERIQVLLLLSRGYELAEEPEQSKAYAKQARLLQSTQATPVRSRAA